MAGNAKTNQSKDAVAAGIVPFYSSSGGLILWDPIMPRDERGRIDHSIPRKCAQFDPLFAPGPGAASANKWGVVYTDDPDIIRIIEDHMEATKGNPEVFTADEYSAIVTAQAQDTLQAAETIQKLRESEEQNRLLKEQLANLQQKPAPGSPQK